MFLFFFFLTLWELFHLHMLSVVEHCICFLFSSSYWWATREPSLLIQSSTKSLGTWWVQELHYNHYLFALESMHSYVWRSYITMPCFDSHFLFDSRLGKITLSTVLLLIPMRLLLLCFKRCFSSDFERAVLSVHRFAIYNRQVNFVHRFHTHCRLRAHLGVICISTSFLIKSTLIGRGLI